MNLPTLAYTRASYTAASPSRTMARQRCNSPPMRDKATLHAEEHNEKLMSRERCRRVTPMPTRERSFQRDGVTMDSLGQVCEDHLASFHNEGGENDLLCNFNVYLSFYH
jgi:hypothetical protein